MKLFFSCLIAHLVFHFITLTKIVFLFKIKFVGHTSILYPILSH